MPVRSTLFKFIITFAVVAIRIAHASPPLELSENLTSTKSIGHHIEYKISNEKDYSPEGFKSNKNDVINAGYIQRPIWLRINISNRTSTKQKRIIHLSSGLLLFDQVLAIKGKEHRKISFGNDRPFEIFNAFKIELNPHSSMTYVIKISTLNRIETEVLLHSEDDFIKKESAFFILNSVYVAILLTLFIYNLILYFLMKEKAYLIYSSFIFSMIITVTTITGFLTHIFAGGLIAKYLGVFAYISIIFSYLFADELLDFKKVNTKIFEIIKRVFFVIAIIGSTGIIIPGLDPYNMYIGYFIDFTVMLMFAFLLGATVYINKTRPTIEAKVYLLSWIILYISAITYFVSIYGFLSLNFFTQNLLIFGNIFEVFTVSIALGLKVNRISRENEIRLLKNQDQQKYIRLLRVLSHDIANSLFIISGYASRYLRRGSVDNEKVWPKVHSACLHIKGILDNVKSEQALINNNPKLNDFTLKKLFEDIELIFSSQCDQKNIRLNLNLENPDVVIHSNQTMLAHQIIGNIISNSIKFTPKNGVISVNSITNEDSYQILIKDNGIGMTKETLSKINRHIDTGISYGTMGEKGTGFGYFIIRSYAKLLNIRFSIESDPSGTDVTLYIPK